MKKQNACLIKKFKYQLLLLSMLILLLVVSMISGCDDHAETTEENTPDAPRYNTIELSKDIIAEANEYLRTRKLEYDYIGLSLGEQLDMVKEGGQLLYIKFAADDCYFVCAYYNTDGGQKADESFDDPEKYVWVGFADETDIPELYNGAECVGVVQVNRTEFCRGIVSGESAIPTVENIIYFKPDFENGYNTNQPREMDEAFVYVNDSDKKNVYYYSHPKHWRRTLSCIELDGEFYVTTWAFKENGELDEELLKSNFGGYYDQLINVMITDKYNAEYPGYGLLKFEDIAKALGKR